MGSSGLINSWRMAATLIMLSGSACSNVSIDSQPTTSTVTQQHSEDHSHQGTTSETTAPATTQQHSEDHPPASDELAVAYSGNYEISDPDFGTQTTVLVSNGMRQIVTNALPDHATGQFPNQGNPNTISAQSSIYQYPADPVYTGTARDVHVPGVAVNGVKFEPGTAETVSCVTGETYRVEGLQDRFDLGMDFNNAHVQPTGAYHYHGLSDLLAETHKHSESDLVHVGFAADGHLMYVSLAGLYKSSYRLSGALRAGSNCMVSLGGGQGPNIAIESSNPDGTYTSDWEYVDGLGDLDECNGISINQQYVYIVTRDFPFISRCLMGEFDETRQGGPPIGGSQSAQPGQAQGQPDLRVAATLLGVTEEKLRQALGPPPPNIETAADTLGVSAAALRHALDESR
ncbi:MAG: YHYH protein [Actinomycetota bacterium]|nr:YHYH protein [Actinomycetota bacterium]